jgi:hypothetical protein
MNPSSWIEMYWIAGLGIGSVVAAGVVYRQHARTLTSLRIRVENLQDQCRRVRDESSVLRARLSLAPRSRADIEAKTEIIEVLRARLPPRWRY